MARGRQVQLQEDRVLIPLSKGYVATVDVADHSLVCGYTWTALETRGLVYAYTKERGTRRTILLHRLLTAAGPSDRVDHIDGNGLNNQRYNLRLCSHKENSRNARKRTMGVSQYKGTQRNKNGWSALIKVDGRTNYLGYFESEEAAARAYDTAAKEFFGEFACLNFP